MSAVRLLIVVALLAATARIEAETLRFVPQRFYNTYSFAHPPALHDDRGR